MRFGIPLAMSRYTVLREILVHELAGAEVLFLILHPFIFQRQILRLGLSRRSQFSWWS